MRLNCVDRAWPYRINRQGCQGVNCGVGITGNSRCALERWIADQVATRGPATRSIGMVNTAHSPQDRLSSAGHVPGKSNARLQVDRLLFSEALRYCWIIPLNYAVELIAGTRDECANQIASQKIGSGIGNTRIIGLLIRTVTG